MKKQETDKQETVKQATVKQKQLKKEDVIMRPEIAEIMGVSEKTISRLAVASENRMPREIGIVDKKFIYDRKQIEKWIADKAIASGNDGNSVRPRAGLDKKLVTSFITGKNDPTDKQIKYTLKRMIAKRNKPITTVISLIGEW